MSVAAKERIEKLKELINQYNYEYHVQDDPSVSDAVFDGLWTELKELEAKHPDLVTSDSPTQRMTALPQTEFSKVKHSQRMFSLNDVFSRDDVEAWIKRMEKLVPGHKTDYFADIKMDGFACALIYQDGVLVQAVTRGDGLVGEDVTNNVRTINNVPLRLNKTSKNTNFLQGRTEIRGEIVMYKADFEELNRKREAEGQPKFANPRNLAAGTIRQLDPRLVAERPLKFRAYDILREDPNEVATNDFAYTTIRSLGISCNTEARVFASLDEVMKFIDAWDEDRQKLPFNTDGLVVKVNDRTLYRQLGFVGKTPRGAVAFKYAAEEATTVVRDIVISIGRTGAATPVAVFNPVVVAGTTVQHASLHNADEIERRDIRVGDTVVIYKAGDIIPQVDRIIPELRPKDSKPFNYESELKRQYPELEFERPEGEVVYRVTGETGPLILKRSVEHFASKGALDIDGMGEKNVIALVNAGLVNDLADLFSLTKEQVIALDRFAELSASNLIAAIADKKHVELARFIFGLGVRHVGAQTAIDLANKFKTLNKLSNATLDDLRAVDGIGEVVAESVLGWFADPDNEALLVKFTKLGVEPIYHDVSTGKLNGLSFVITGSLQSMSRDEAADKIRALGGTFQSSVAKGTTYLVMGDKAGNSKADKARKLGTEVIDETKLLEILGN